jgi:hypothetical protein
LISSSIASPLSGLPAGVSNSIPPAYRCGAGVYSADDSGVLFKWEYGVLCKCEYGDDAMWYWVSLDGLPR